MIALTPQTCADLVDESGAWELLVSMNMYTIFKDCFEGKSVAGLNTLMMNQF